MSRQASPLSVAAVGLGYAFGAVVGHTVRIAYVTTAALRRLL